MFLDDPLISNVIFYPRKTEIPEILDDNVKIIQFKIDNDVIIGSLLYLKDINLPTILMFHGNGEIAEDYSYFYLFFHDCGVNLAVADYRGYGFSTGTPLYSGLISDAMPIFLQFKAWIEKSGLKNSLFVLGKSLGSVCAAEIGFHNPMDLKGIIFDSGFASIYNMMTGLFGVSGPDITQKALETYSNDTRVKKFNKPTLVIHGTADWIVPCEEGEMLYQSIPEGVEKKLVLIKGAGHNDIFSFQDEYFTPLKEFIKKFK